MTTPARVRPPFPYFGGKQTLGPRIAAVLPGHQHYVEPYGGSLAVLLAKPPSTMETVNDLDQDVMTFWRVLRERPDELIRACALTPHSRVEYEAASDRDECDDLERARRVWVKLTQGRGGTLRRSGWRTYVKPVGTTAFPAYLTGYVDRMAPVLERLQRVSLECRPALDVIRRYGAEPDVLLYVDPPYLATSRASEYDQARSRHTTHRYQHEMLREDAHTELLAALLDCRAAVVLSGYPSALYVEQLADWHRLEFLAGTGQSARGEWSQRTEVLWSNRPLGRPVLTEGAREP